MSDDVKSGPKAAKETFREQAKAKAKTSGKQLKELLKGLSAEQRDLLMRKLKPQRKTDDLARYGHAVDAPLSFAQEREWFRYRLFPDVAHNVSGAFRLDGPLSMEALSAACDGVLLRHDALRTTFDAPAGTPVQRIAPVSPLPINVIDLADVPDCDLVWRRHYAAEMTRPFNLTRDCLLRVTLLRLAAESHVLFLTLQHIVSDGWSIGVLIAEFSEIYSAYVQSREPALPPLPIQYADFAVWQRERMQGGALDEGLAYWGKQLQDPPRPLALEPDRIQHGVTAAERDHEGASCAIRIEPSLKRALEELSRVEGMTFFVTLLTAFLVLLMRCTGVEDLLVGSPVSGRLRLETEPLIGLFLNTLALRARLGYHMTFREAMAVVRTTVLGALDHAEVPIERVVQDLGLDRSARVQPLFETVFNFVPATPRRIDLAGLRVHLEDAPGLIEEFSTQLFISECDGTLDLDLRYRKQRYTKARMAAFLDQYVTVLEQIARDSSSLIGRLDLTTPGSRMFLPDATRPLDQPAQLPVPHLIAGWIARTPNAIAVQQGEEVVTFAQFGTAMAANADLLCERGLAPGDVVAVFGERSPGLIAAMAGTLLAGGVLLTLSPDLPEQRRRLMIAEAGARFLLNAGDSKMDVDEVEVLSIDAHLRDAVAAEDDLARHLAVTHQRAYVFFTSGSTGTPKSVLGTHAGLAHWLAWQKETFDVGPHDRCGQLTGLSFDVVLRDVFLPLTSGATLVLPEPADTASGAGTLRWLERERISLLHTVPAVADLWLRDTPAGITLRNLRRLFFAGEPLTATLIARWREAFPESGEIINIYGPTETTLAKCFYRVPANLRAGVQPLGTTLPQTQALVLTPENALCGIGEPGQIAIRTPFRTLGYRNAPEENRKRFIANPFRDDPDDIVYLTGDRGVYGADGLLEFRGRVDHQVKIRGVRVEPGEVAAALQDCPDVASCAVIARDDDGDGPVLVAYVVLEKNASEDVGRLQHFLSQRLPAAMVPNAFVFLDTLPLTANQKLDRDRLPAPSRLRATAAIRYVAPRDPTELQLVQIWEELLNVQPIGVTDRFFEVGGHSLLALRLLVEVEQRLGRRIPLPALFEEPTIEHLAAVLRRDVQKWPLMVMLRAGVQRQKLFLIHPGGGILWNYVHLVRHLSPEVPVYGIQARGLDGMSEPHESLEEMAADYIAEILRVQPEGPYLLAGHSFGGVIAFEMARQLHDSNERVGFLGLFDSVAPLVERPQQSMDERRDDALRLTQMAGTIARFLGMDNVVTFEDLCDLSTDEQIEHVVSALQRTRALLPGEEQKLLRNLLKVNKAHLRAHRAYQAAPVPIPITLFRAESALAADYPSAGEELLRHESLGWSNLSTEPVRVLRAAGSHVTMLSSGHAEALAQRLSPCLHEAVAKGETPCLSS
jgi:amino acid adenylation domain-containing protein